MAKSRRVAIVTGAAQGIGKAILSRFLAEGYFVIAIDVDEKGGEELVLEFGREAMKFICADVSSSDSVAGVFKKVVRNPQRLDVLVNNAGIIRDNLIWNMSEEEFDMVMLVNLKGTWLMCREAAKLMKQQKSGRIINISSRAWLGNPGQGNYSASKAGVISLTRVLALELGRHQVYVNAVAPGLIDTPLTQKLEKEVLQKLIAAQPTKTMGAPEDIANAVSFLASEKTCFITGQVFYVDGGKSIGAGI